MVPGSACDVRRANLSVLLQLLFLHGPLTRAELGKSSGRNRSTIASYISELEQLGFVYEYEDEYCKKTGRPSPMVSLRSDIAVVAVNPEIDLLTIGLVGLDGQILQMVRHVFDHVPCAEEVVKVTGEVVATFQKDLINIVAVGLAIPGLTQEKNGVVVSAPHLNWVDVPLADMVEYVTGLPVWAANDASLGAMAELNFGAGKGRRHLLYLNGGASGIGGGIVHRKHSLRGAVGFAGELGHVKVSDSQIRKDSAGLAGTLEAMVTRSELLRVMGLENPDDLMQELSRLDDADPARKVVRRQLNHLAAGLSTAINLLNPELIILGGFLNALFACDPEYLLLRLAKRTLAPTLPQIVVSQLEPNQLIIGAAQLAFQDLLQNPFVYDF